MVIHLAVLAGLVFIIVVLVKGLQRPNRVANRGGVPPIINDDDFCRRSKNADVLATDNAEYYNLLEKHSADPLHVPPPIPPSKPHPYWGNEADVFGNKSASGEEID
jgi:hypothetical protein